MRNEEALLELLISIERDRNYVELVINTKKIYKKFKSYFNKQIYDITGIRTKECKKASPYFIKEMIKYIKNQQLEYIEYYFETIYLGIKNSKDIDEETINDIINSIYKFCNLESINSRCRTYWSFVKHNRECMTLFEMNHVWVTKKMGIYYRTEQGYLRDNNHHILIEKKNSNFKI